MRLFAVTADCRLAVECPLLRSTVAAGANYEFIGREITLSMDDEAKKEIGLEIGHVLFIDIVGYSKLLITEQSERLQKLKDSLGDRAVPSGASRRQTAAATYRRWWRSGVS
jgi:hypothetical protein